MSKKKLILKKKLISKYKLCYKYRSNLWGDFRLYTKLKNRKWKRIFFTTKLRFKYAKKKANKRPEIIKKRFYKFQLIEKQKFKHFFGSKLNKQFKNLVSLHKNKYLFFFKTIESRLDVVLYRSYFFFNIRQCQFLIKKGHISVNNKIIKNVHFLLKKNDIVKILLSRTVKKHILETFYKKSKYFLRYTLKIRKQFFYPRHLLINLRTLKIIYVKDIQKLEHIFYPTTFNLTLINRFFVR